MLTKPIDGDVTVAPAAEYSKNVLPVPAGTATVLGLVLVRLPSAVAA